MMETIDILLASYNGSRFIENQILSIIGQTYKNWILYILFQIFNNLSGRFSVTPNLPTYSICFFLQYNVFPEYGNGLGILLSLKTELGHIYDISLI